MKCQQCSTDAPAETDPQSGRLRCPNCRAYYGTGTTQTAAVRHARDILQKWSTADLLDQISSFPQVPPLGQPVDSGPARESDSGSTSDVDERTGHESQNQQSEEPAVADPMVATDRDSARGEPDETADILRMPDASVQLDAADSGEVTQDDSGAVAAPQLSIVRADRSTQAVSDEPAAEDSTESPVRPASGKPRRLTRPTVKRRVIPTPGGSVTTQQTATVEEGMEPVKKKLRVDQPGPHAPAADMTSPVEESVTADPRAQDASTTRRFRIDAAQGMQDLTDGGGRVRSQTRPHNRYIDEAHETAGLRGPHFEVSAPRRSSLTSLTGQFLAYIGVLGLTVGTAIVIYGHFGGMSEYTPTGWLVTTVAQMLLFLGIINLVSGGIEQNNIDVSRRINVLGEQLMRIEQVTENAMRGPRIPIERYAGTSAGSEATEKEAAYVDDRR